MKIAYLVHDLNDPAVARRMLMLQAGGAEVRLAGFWRGEAAPATVEGAPAVALARTQDGHLAVRALSVLRHALVPDLVGRAAEGADVLIARNLETLVLAARCARGRPIVYESLDIHRSLLSAGAPGRVLRRLERWLLARTALLLTSSPAFRKNYFEPRQGWSGPSLLLENKVLDLSGQALASSTEPPAGPPWIIGWFGNLRCLRSLEMLGNIAANSGGRIKVVLRGRPARNELPDFDAAVTAGPHLSFGGSYSAADLPGLYGAVHFAWAIDYFEEGLNSAWLLPNRIYEAGAQGTPAIALASTETGAWLAKHGCGLRVDDPEVEVGSLLGGLPAEAYFRLREEVSSIPPGDVRADTAECRRLVEALRTLRP